MQHSPCFAIASNGIDIFAGFWDQAQPVLTLRIADLGIGTTATEQLVSFCPAVNHLVTGNKLVIMTRFLQSSKLELPPALKSPPGHWLLQVAKARLSDARSKATVDPAKGCRRCR
jgi:hypothetical protein